MYPCGHDSQIADKFEIRTLTDGRSERIRLPQKFRARGPNAYYCSGCHQVIDAQDEPDKSIQRSARVQIERTIIDAPNGFGKGETISIRRAEPHMTPRGVPDGLDEESYWRGYTAGFADQGGSGVLQAVLDAISGKLDPHTQIADHPNVKFAQMERLKLLRSSRESGEAD